LSANLSYRTVGSPVDVIETAKGWYVSSELALASTLLDVDLSGNATILLREPGLFTETWGIPSPDDKHFAFLRYNFGNNAWVLEGF